MLQTSYYRMSSSSEPEPEGLEIRTYFVRNRNALLARADFGELFVDYYLHLAEHNLRYSPANDNLLKETLAALTLHCASRPWRESTAWTLNFQEPLVNLFVAGDNNVFGVTGQVFPHHVKQSDHCMFYADVIGSRGDSRRSVVQFQGADPFRAVEAYYAQSEQRPARYFKFDVEDYVMVTAQPDCDMTWFASLTDEAIRSLDQTEVLSLLERREYRWHCGCNQNRMLGFLAPSMKTDAEELFQGTESLRMSCPRCGARYTITREVLEAFVESKESE